MVDMNLMGTLFNLLHPIIGVTYNTGKEDSVTIKNLSSWRIVEPKEHDPCPMVLKGVRELPTKNIIIPFRLAVLLSSIIISLNFFTMTTPSITVDF